MTHSTAVRLWMTHSTAAMLWLILSTGILSTGILCTGILCTGILCSAGIPSTGVWLILFMLGVWLILFMLILCTGGLPWIQIGVSLPGLGLAATHTSGDPHMTMLLWPGGPPTWMVHCSIESTCMTWTTSHSVALP